MTQPLMETSHTDSDAALALTDEEVYIFPASFAQQRLWFLDQFDPGSPLYNIFSATRMQGTLRVAALEQSIQEMTRRHESLRTTMAMIDGKPAQVIHPFMHITLAQVDLQALGNKEQEAETLRLVLEEAQRPFDLEQGPLLRTMLLRHAAEEHILLLSMHHIISDGWSLGIFIQETAHLYEAFCHGNPSPLAALPIQYADFAVWQRDWLQGHSLQEQLTYWKHQLGDQPPVLKLPTDHPRPAVQTSHGARQACLLSRHLSEALKALSHQEDATLFMTLLAAFQVLLARYTQQDHLCIGTPIANRTRAETEGLIGFFVNTLVLRTDLSGDPSFRELVQRVREVALGAYAHQDLPFERLVEELNPTREMSHTPLFQVMFVLQNTPMPPLKLAGLTLSSLGIDRKTAKFDLLLSMVDTEQGLAASLEYNADLFDATTMRRMLEHLQVLLEGIVADPQQRIASLPLLPAAEKQRLLVEWNDTATAYPRGQSIHELFEAQVERSPEAIVVVYEDQHLTYHELNRRANRLAHRLQALGVGPEVPVGLCVERSLDMVVGTLGILKAGGAYMPLDPAYPPVRLAFMVSDTQTPVLLTQQRFVAILPTHGAQVLCLDTGWEAMAHEREDNPASGSTAENLAYVMYTSGSTGQPKGTSIIHRSVVRLVQATNYVDLTAHDVLLQFAPISFDAATLELWGSLLNGARLVVFPAHPPSVEELGAVLQRYQVTTLWLTAGLFHLMVDERLEDLRSVRQLLAGGDVLSVPHVQKVVDALPGCQVINGYGPTENTTFTCCYPVPATVSIGRSVPIGRPIANTQVYVLDRYLCPIPVGVAGELYIGGDGLAREYFHRPELTAEKFWPHPFSQEPGARLYKTGDLVRYQSDGNLEFLGRIDHQVKLRGFRIELSELEAVLSQHPAVRDVIVVVREEELGDKRLVAYVVPDPAQTPTGGELRHFIQQQLPKYMVPAAVMLLDALPLNPNGKVDRQALPEPEWSRPAAVEGAFVTPRTPVEEMLAGIWAQVLGLDQVSIHDNFFDLGGHSLLATQVISRLREAFQVELPVRQLFEAPTVATLAVRLEALQAEQQGLAVPPLLPVSSTPAGPLPLSFAQQRLWILEQLDPGNPAYNIAIAVRLTGPLHMAALAESFTELVRRHAALRTTFVAQAGQPVQVVTPAHPLPVPIIDLREVPATVREAEARRLAEIEAYRPFDLGSGPLLRVILLRLDTENHVLLVTMHHIISDGWSMSIVVRELARLYDAYVNATAAALPTLPIQYTDFAIWQRQWLQGDALEVLLAYWKQQLQGSPPRLALPTDRPRPAVQTSGGATLARRLPTTVAAALRALSRQEGVTLFMTLLAAWQTLLCRYTQQDDISVGTSIANRTRAETEGLIGFFVNTLVLRTDLSGDPSFRELLQRVRDVALEAYAHQDLPFEKLVDELNPVRDMSYTPLFQVMFTLQNAPMAPLELVGLTLSPLGVDKKTAKFDLLLSMVDTEQGLAASLEYNTDLFHDTTIARMLEHFQTLLAGIVADPEQRLSSLPLITDSERQQLLVEWNETTTSYPHEQCFHHLFATQVERTPDRIAVVCGEQHLTYAELNTRANQLAHHLQTLGVGPEVLVALCVERSLEMLLGLLGILKAGGAYLPLDPAYPSERLAFMLQDAQAPVLLTQQRLLGKLPASRARVLCLDTDWATLSGACRAHPSSATTPQHLAYVLYTSGSTGQPKGTMIAHQGLMNYLHWCTQVYLTEGGRGAPVHSPIGFDLTITSLFSPLLVGQSTVLLPETQEIESLCTLLRTEGDFSLVKITPAHLEVLSHLLSPEEVQGRTRALIIGGEALWGTSLAFWQTYAPHTRLINEYGPTETVVGCCVYEAPPGTSLVGAVPIGRPTYNTQLYILDAHLQPTPIGVPGELYIGGAGLARGYLNRPDLTAEKFIPHPFSAEPGARLYKTGDLARYQPDGHMAFLGRSDDQVKIRGFRIELGEVEAALSQHPDVHENVVIVREDTPGDKRLVAYVVPRGEQAPAGSDLRSFLRQKLPEYMVPAALVILEQLPLTPNGKVDRRALPRPERQGLLVAPRNPVEQRVAGIWAEVLGLEQVGIHDNFFELGGNSLLATQVVSRLRDAFQVELPVRRLFDEGATVAGLVGLIETIHWAAQGVQTAPSPTQDSREEGDL